MRILSFGFVVCWIFSTVAARALTTNLVPIADTALRSTAPDQNFGADSSLPIGVSNTGSPVNHALFRFDLSVLPTNAIINDVSLGLTNTKNPKGDSFDLHRLLSSWSESEATWNNRFVSVAWAAGGAQAGTDFITSPSASAAVGSGVTLFNSPVLTSDVRAWILNPGTNFGWILMATGEPAGTGEQVGSREDPDNTPILTIDYDLPLPPVIVGTQLVGNQIRFSFDVQGGFTYTVEFRDSLTAGNWNVLTNIPAQLDDITTINLTNTVSSVERYFRVRAP
jgi:hypothetical protein